MRCLLTASLVIAGLSSIAAAHTSSYSHPPLPRRKSLAFGPPHPHAVFHASPSHIQEAGFTPVDVNMDPRDIAMRFVDDVLGVSQTTGMGYRIRKDSYTDKNTGVTHIYVKQLVNGLEVADGDVNINIKDGVVISYGSSFFNGPVPTPFEESTGYRDHRQEFCSQLHSETAVHFNAYGESASQTPLTRGGVKHHVIAGLSADNCQNREMSLPASFSEDPMDPRSALLTFMMQATPSEELSKDIKANPQKSINGIHVKPVHHFTNEDSSPEFMLGNVPGAVSDVKARLAYHQVMGEDERMHLQLVWKFEVEMQDNWYETAMSTTAPHQIVSVVDWASDLSFAPVPPPSKKVTAATYNVFSWGVNDPSCGNRTSQKENYDPLASPGGWHAIPAANDPSFKGNKGVKWSNSTTTWGNNVFAQENWEGQNQFIYNYRPDGGKDLKFDYKYAPKQTAKDDALEESKKHINATVAQLFYTTNMVHDLYYRYGFDEVSGNFQQYNYERGGEENDAVIANAQDGSGYNNANFMTPPDGQNGRMRMYLWNTALPFRDGDLEAGIVIHELSHGLSTRLTGGPANSGCLGWGESGGMGEGWGDFLATVIRSGKEYHDFAMGAWAANEEKGIRNYPYSLDDKINPSTYKTLDKPGYWGVHAIGEVWAEILWVVAQRLIKKHGYIEDLFPPAPSEDGTVPAGDFYRTPEDGKPLVPKHGNSLIVQLVLNGMKLQDCRPSFFDARDAIIQADQVLTGGENFCDLWLGFAERGLGVDAIVKNKMPWGGGVRTNGYASPRACEGYDA